MRFRAIGCAVLFLAVASSTTFAKAADAAGSTPDADPNYRTIVNKTGKLTARGGTLQTLINPETSHWRLAIRSTRTDDGKKVDDSLVRMTIWIEEADKSGHKSFHSLDGVAFKGRGGDGTELSFDNGLGSDGKPQRFKITIDGRNVSVDVQAQDESDKALPHSKKDKK